MTGSDLPRVTTVDTSDQDHDNIQSVRIDEDSVTGDVTATTTRIIRGDDGTASKITTTEKFNKGSANTVGLHIGQYETILRGPIC